MMRVLVIDDDCLLTRAITLMLKAGGVEYETTAEGEAGFELARLYDYDAIILDLTLPDVSGRDVLRRLRLARIDTPVLILSGDGGTVTKVDSFALGADDYMSKPFEADELIARLHALVRRSQGHANSTIRTGSMTIDLRARLVTVADHRVALTGKEYAILELLSLRKGLTMTKEMFLTHLYGGRDEPELKIIDVFVCKLRKKLADADPDAASCIETVWGRGYALRDPEAGLAVKAA